MTGELRSLGPQELKNTLLAIGAIAKTVFRALNVRHIYFSDASVSVFVIAKTDTKYNNHGVSNNLRKEVVFKDLISAVGMISPKS